MKNNKLNEYSIKPTLSSLLISLIIPVYLCSTGGNHHGVAQEIVLLCLNLAIDILHLLACVIIAIGSILLAARYLSEKMRSPLKPIQFKPVARYLIVGLDILIGAELLSTITAGTFEEIIRLFLVITARFFIAFLIHMEKKWGELA